MKKVFLLCLLFFATAGFAQQQHINVGTAANDHTGDPLRTAFQKTESNFNDLFGYKSASLDSILKLSDSLRSHNIRLKNQLDSIYLRYTKAQTDGRFAPISHTQAISTVAGLQDSLTDHYTKVQTDTALRRYLPSPTGAAINYTNPLAFYYQGDLKWRTTKGYMQFDIGSGTGQLQIGDFSNGYYNTATNCQFAARTGNGSNGIALFTTADWHTPTARDWRILTQDWDGSFSINSAEPGAAPNNPILYLSGKDGYAKVPKLISPGMYGALSGTALGSWTGGTSYTDYFWANSTDFSPATDNTFDLGQTGMRFKDGWFGGSIYIGTTYQISGAFFKISNKANNGFITSMSKNSSNAEAVLQLDNCGDIKFPYSAAIKTTSDATLWLGTNNNNRWAIRPSTYGYAFAPSASLSYDIGMSNAVVRRGYFGTIRQTVQDTTGLGSTDNVGLMIYQSSDSHFYGLKSGTPPAWVQLDN